MYKTIEEKEKQFISLKINTLEELEQKVDILSKNDSLRFRGVSEAKYSMVTTLQRTDFNNQRDYIEGLLDAIRNSRYIQNYFRKKEVDINDLSLLSLMQHFGLPTPLLDFSTDIEVALSFAAKRIKKKNRVQDIDDFASLYFFDINKEYEVNYNLQLVLANGTVDMENAVREYERLTGTIVETESLDEYTRWAKMKEIELIFLEYQEIAPGVFMLDGESLNINNVNAVRQKGCFILNNYKEDMPLEDNWNMRTKQNRMAISASLSSGDCFPFSGVYTMDKLNCYNIKKDVLLQWKKRHPRKLYDYSINTLITKFVLKRIQNKYNKSIK